MIAKHTLSIVCVLLLGSVLATGAHPIAGTTVLSRRASKQVTDSEAREVRFIERFYADCVFGEHEDPHSVTERSCTEKLRKRLRATYAAEYDGEGYAIWLFRSGAQDGPSDESRVTSVIRLGKGLYRVELIDMGIEGSRTLKLVTRDGKLFFDEITE